jgi:hypothetical protein
MLKNLLVALTLAILFTATATQVRANEIPTTEQPPEEEAKSKKKTTSCSYSLPNS